MSIEQGIYSALTNDAAFNALVSGRVYHLHLPQNADFPCASFDVEQQEEPTDYDGQGTFGAVEITLHYWADQIADCRTLAGEGRAVLKNYSGALGTEHVFRTRLTGQVSVFEQDVGQDGKYRFTQIYSLLCR